MAFAPEPTRTPESIETVVVILKDSINEIGEPYQSAAFRVRIVMSDGSATVRRGDLVPHITVAQRTALQDFMTSLRQQAVEQIIGE